MHQTRKTVTALAMIAFLAAAAVAASYATNLVERVGCSFEAAPDQCDLAGDAKVVIFLATWALITAVGAAIFWSVTDRRT